MRRVLGPCRAHRDGRRRRRCILDPRPLFSPPTVINRRLFGALLSRHGPRLSFHERSHLSASLVRPSGAFFLHISPIYVVVFQLNEMKWLALCLIALVMVTLAVAEGGEVWEEDDHEVVIRNERAAKNRGEECRYGKGGWSECDQKTNMRSRTLTLKKGNQPTCEQTKTIQKKCKKACRYEKGVWGECNAQSMMARSDKLKSTGVESNCEPTREITKKCKPKGAKPTKATRRNRQ